MTKKKTEKPVILITGHAGLLGTALSKRFAEGFCVVGLDVKEPPEKVKGVDSIECDLTDDDAVHKTLEKVRDTYGSRIATVIHLAAYYDFSGESSPLYKKLTVEGTRRLINGLQSLEFDVDQFIYSSSLLVMKPADKVEDRDTLTEDAPTRAEWGYPESKLRAEQVLKDEKGVISVVVLRIAGVYTDQCQSMPIADHIRRIHQKELESYLFPGDKEHGQPFIHLYDLVDCFEKTVAKRKELKPWELFLIAEPMTLSHSDLQETIGELLHGKEWPTLRIPKPVAKAGAWAKDKLPWEDPFIKPWMVDLADDDYSTEIERAIDRLEWRPIRRLNDGLGKMIDFLHRDPEGFYEVNNLALPEKMKNEPEQSTSS